MAANRARPESDVDLFVIGDVGLRKLSALLKGATNRIGRERTGVLITIEP